MTTLIIQIQTLEFTIESKDRSRGQGGKAWKIKFLTDAFQASDDFKSQFAGLTNEQKTAKMGELRQEFSDWKKQNQETVTRRNRLLYMYKMVSHFSSDTQDHH